MCYLKKEEVRVLKTREELQDALEYFDATDRWLFPEAGQVSVIGLEDYPLLNMQQKAEIKSQYPAGNEENFENCYDEAVKDAGLFVTIPDGAGFVTYPARYTALTSIYDRSGTNCRIIRALTDRTYTTALPADQRAEIITRGFRTSKEPVKVLISDDMVSFIGSEKYVILPYMDGIAMAEETLGKAFVKMEYSNGYISHEFLCADWEVESAETESHKLALEDTGLLSRYAQDVTYIFRFSSSNIGSAKMSGRMLMKIGHVLLPIGSPQSVWHLSSKAVKTGEEPGDATGSSIADLKYKFSHKLAASLKDNEDLVEELGNTQIAHPAGCMQRLLGFCPSIPKKLKEEAVDAMDDSTPAYAIDVYLGIAEIIGKLKNLNSLIQVMEEVAQLQGKNFTAFDKPVKEV